MVCNNDDDGECGVPVLNMVELDCPVMEVDMTVGEPEAEYC